MTGKSRRQILRVTGIAIATGLAGCGDSGDGGNEDGGDSEDGDSGDTATPGDGQDITTTPEDDGTETPSEGDDGTATATPAELSGIEPDATYVAPVENPVGVGYQQNRGGTDNLVVLGEGSSDNLVVTDGISATVKETYTVSPSGGWSPSGVTDSGDPYVANNATQSLLTGVYSGFTETVSLPGTTLKGIHHDFNGYPVCVVTKDGSDVVIVYDDVNDKLVTEVPTPDGTAYGTFHFTLDRASVPDVWVNNPKNRTFYRLGKERGEEGTVKEQFQVAWENPGDCAYLDDFDDTDRVWNLAGDTIYEFTLP